MSERPSKVLQACLGTAQGLLGLVDYAPDSVVSKTLLDKPTGTITLFAFDKGQGLSEHTSPYDAVVQVVDGTAHLTIGGQVVEARAGEVIVMPANITHAVNAREHFKMLLTLIRG